MHLLSLFVVCLLGCKSVATRSDVKTDLLNNEEVATTFRNHKNSDQHCVAPGQDQAPIKRVMVSGFGLFGDTFNISGIAAMNFVSSDFVGAPYDLSEDSQPDLGDLWLNGDSQTNHGVFIQQKTVTIDDETYEVCGLLLDVKWDLAAAIILNEAALFQPDLVIMGGMNGSQPYRTFFESGAVNVVTDYAGFEASGIQAFENAPTSAGIPILEDMPTGQIVALTWDAEELARVNARLVTAINRQFVAEVGLARTQNNYICNNVSFAVNEGLRGRDVRLAGGTITIPGLNYGAKVGFLHYPRTSSQPGYADNAEAVYGWMLVLANSLKTSLSD